MGFFCVQNQQSMEKGVMSGKDRKLKSVKQVRVGFIV